MTRPLLDEPLWEAFIEQGRSSRISPSSINEALIALFDDALALVDENGTIHPINSRAHQMFDPADIHANPHLKAV